MMTLGDSILSSRRFMQSLRAYRSHRVGEYIHHGRMNGRFARIGDFMGAIRAVTQGFSGFGRPAFIFDVNLNFAR